MRAPVNSPGLTGLRAEDGRGTMGCLLFLLLAGAAVFVAIRVGPDYYAYKEFQTAVETEVARAGANFMDDETITKNLLALAKRNEIRLKQEDIKLEHFAGKVHVTIKYTVTADLPVYQRDINYEIKSSSFVGRL